MNLRLIDIMFRPFRTSRKLIRLLRDIEVTTALKPQNQKPAESAYVVIHSTVMLPSGVYNMIKDNLTKVDSKYDSHTRRYVFSRQKDQTINITSVKHDEYIAMLVAERFDAVDIK